MSRRYRIHEAFWVVIGLAGWVACGVEARPEGDARPEARGSAVYLRAFSSFDMPRGDETFDSHPADPAALMRFDDPLGTVYSLTAAELQVESIRLQFRAGQTCTELAREYPAAMDGLACEDHALQIPGPFAIDLLDGRIYNGRLLPGPSAAAALAGAKKRSLPALDYRQIELQLAPPPSAHRGASTFHARASFQEHAAIRRLTVIFDFQTTLKRAVPAPLSPGDSLILAFDIADWLDHIPVSDCLERGHLSAVDGEVILDANLDTPMRAYYRDEPPRDCQDAQAQFRANFERSLRVHIESEKTTHNGPSNRQ